MQEKRIQRLKIIGIIGIIYSILLIGYNLIGELSVFDMIIGCFLFLCSIVFIISSNKLKKINGNRKKGSSKR